MPKTAADEADRLRAAELDAKHRYYEAVEESDLTATREAARNWIKAGDSLAAYVDGTHTHQEHWQSG
jgi:hypothetical protein